MNKSRLEVLQKYSIDALQSFLKTRQSGVIPENMQEYILQLDSVARLMHGNRLSVRKCIDQLRREWPQLSIAQARGIYYDALDYYYFDDTSSAKSWDMVYADQLEDLKTLAIAADKYDVAYKCMVKAHELRTLVRESESYNWQAPVFLINVNVKPEDLGYESKKLADIAKRAEDRKYREMIMSLETTDAEKERLLLEAGIQTVEPIKIEEEEYGI
jgi:hypothetical protein